MRLSVLSVPTAWPALIVYGACLVFTASFASLRFQPVSAQNLWLLLLPLLWLVVLPRVVICDGWLQRWWALAVALMLWMVVVHLTVPSLPSAAWWRLVERCAALCACLLVAIGGVPTGVLIRLLGISASLSLLVSVSIAWWFEVEQTGPGGFGFGLGNPNYLANTAGPALLAWTVYRLRAGATVAGGRRELALLAVGWLALAVLAHVGQCRGVLVAMAAAACWVGLALIRQRWRWPGSVLIGISAACVLGAGMWLLFGPLPGVLDNRILIYRGAIELIGESWPLGRGHYGAMAMSQCAGEDARHLGAYGASLLHAHNEFLDAAIDGGVVGLLLLVALVAGLAWRVCLIIDPALRLALQAMGMAMLVHASTDNTYGTLIGQSWCAVVAGAMLGAPSATPRLAAWRGFPAARTWAWPLALVAAWGATRATGTAFVHREAYITVHAQAIAQTLDPAALTSHALYAWQQGNREQLGGFTREIARQVERRLGSGEAFLGLSIPMAVGSGTPEEALAHLERGLRRNPFSPGLYRQLALVIARHPHLGPRVQARLGTRLAYLGGAATLPRPALDQPLDGIEDAADLHAALYWSIANQVPWPVVVPALERLVARYADLDGVVVLAVRCARLAPPGSLAGVERWIPVMRRVIGLDIRIAGELDAVATPAQAAAFLPWLQALYPQILDDCRRGRATIDRRADPGSVATRSRVVRIWALARQAAVALTP